MSSLPILYLHLETALLPLFLAMVLVWQMGRAPDPGYYTQNARRQTLALFSVFCVLALGFIPLLMNTAPLLAIELAAGFTLALLHPANALCLFVHLLFLRPWEIAAENNLLLALPRLGAAMCVFSWLLHTARQAKPSPPGHHALNLLIGFSVWVFLSTFGAADMAKAQTEWFNLYFKSIVIFLMSLYVLESERSVAQFKWTIVLSAFALMNLRLFQLWDQGASLVRLQTAGMLGDSNDLAAIVVMALPFALVGSFQKGTDVFRQLFGGLFCLCAFLVIWFSQSRGAMLGLSMQALAWAVIRSRGQKLFRLLFVAGVLCAIGFTAMKAMHRQSEEMEASSESRITYWKTAVNMAAHHPLLGVGFNQYPVNYDAYSIGTKYEWGLRTAHSSWFLVLAETGLLGAALFLAFFVVALKTAWKQRGLWPDHFCAMAGYVVIISFLSHPYVMYPYLLIGLVMAADALRRPQSHG